MGVRLGWVRSSDRNIRKGLRWGRYWVDGQRAGRIKRGVIGRWGWGGGGKGWEDHCCGRKGGNGMR